jgi:hypothetical protein
MTDERSPDPNKGGRDQYKRHIDGSIRVSGQVEVHPPPDSIETENADREDQKSHRNKNFVVSVLTLMAVVFYAGLTFWQGTLLRDSIRNTNNNFQKDQRPYVWATDVTYPAFPKDKIFSWGLKFSNYGRSPAVKLTTCSALRRMPGPAPFQWIFSHLSVPSLDTCENGQQFPSVLPPGKVDFFTAVGDKVLSDDEVRIILDLDAGIVILGAFRYEDRDGNRYISKFCEFRLSNGTVANCPIYNEMN